MDWKDIGGLVANAAPMLGGLLFGPAGAAGGKILASALGTKDDPEEIAKAIQADPEVMVKIRQIEADNARELTRLTLETETRQQAEINATMRKESEAEDSYVRRWRPTIGYVVAAQLAMLGLAIFVAVGGAVVATFQGKPDVVQVLFDGLAALLTSLTAILATELAVLGVNISQRSKDKQVKAGHPPDPGLLGAFAKRLAG